MARFLPDEAATDVTITITFTKTFKARLATADPDRATDWAFDIDIPTLECWVEDGTTKVVTEAEIVDVKVDEVEVIHTPRRVKTW